MPLGAEVARGVGGPEEYDAADVARVAGVTPEKRGEGIREGGPESGDGSRPGGVSETAPGVTERGRGEILGMIGRGGADGVEGGTVAWVDGTAPDDAGT